MNHNKLSHEEVQSIELELLRKFISFCEKHNLVYALTYGTLLGAVRHEGFIPWDDDVDVMMPRNDYELFIEMTRNSPIDGCELRIRDSNNGYYYPFAKLCDKSTIAKMEDNHTEHGIWVDIFPVDHVPDDEESARSFHRHIRTIKNMIISYTTDFDAKQKNWKMIPKFFIAQITKILGIDRIADYLDKTSQKYNTSNSKTVSVVSWQSSEGGNMREEELKQPSYLSFCRMKVCVPQDYDKYLKSIYGNYLEIPPESKRTTHHIIAYRK